MLGAQPNCSHHRWRSRQARNPGGRTAPRPRGVTVGKHSKQQGHHIPQRRTIETLELVDVTGTAHRVTVDAAADGLPGGRYTTLCGGDVLPAALVAKQTRYCRLCAPIPAQRSGSRR
jgi:hypothetical protein